MTSADAAAGLDRLPWLTDKPAISSRRWGRLFRVLAVAVIALAGAYWLDTWRNGRPQSSAARSASSTTVRLPAPRAAAPVRAAPQFSVKLTEAPENRPTPASALAAHATAKSRSTGQARSETTGSRVARRPATPEPLPRKTVPAVVLGKRIQVGAFGSMAQAEHGLAVVVGRNPALAHLKAAVVQSRNSKGRTYYRFQVATTSQAHSEVLCQRMRKVSLSCTVEGMPRNSTGAER